jgi:predicted HNH restriction endonuclease
MFPLKRHLHHKNQDRTDARKENLIFLCPNCHQLADEDARKEFGHLKPHKTMYKRLI